jgi:hypothetical protein
LKEDLMTASNTDARQAANNAAENIRALNHALYQYTGLDEIYAITAELAVLLQRIPQALSMLAGHLDLVNAAGLLQIDEDTRYTGNPAGAVDAYTSLIEQAAALLAPSGPPLPATAAGLVEQAQQVIGRAFQTEPASH